MKCVIITFLLIGATFVRADLGENVEGLLILDPIFVTGVDGYNKVADEVMALSRAMNETKTNCGSSGSGSNDAYMNLSKSNEALAQAIFPLAEAVRNNTNASGQLKLLTGDIRQIPKQIKPAGAALQSQASDIRTLKDNIDTLIFGGFDTLVASQDDSTNALRAFCAAFAQTKIGSKTLLQLNSLVFGFDAALAHLSDALEAQIYSILAAQEECGFSTGLPDSLAGYKEVVDALHRQQVFIP